MNKTIIMLLALLAASLSAADFFPLERGNTWNFSYTIRSSALSPTAPVTTDSGMVKLEALGGISSAVVEIYTFKRSYSLARRTLTGGTVPGYDSTLSPPRVTIDTITASQGVVLMPNPKKDSIENAITFDSATCPVIFHDPRKPLPAQLVVNDTAVSFGGVVRSCTKAGPLPVYAPCNCVKFYLWTFVLADTIGPVEIYIGKCPSFIGTSYKETWKLSSRLYPTSVVGGKGKSTGLHSLAITLQCGRVVISGSANPGPVSVTICGIGGRVVRSVSGVAPGSISVPTTGLARGIYCVQVRQGSVEMGRVLWLQ